MKKKVVAFVRIYDKYYQDIADRNLIEIFSKHK